MKQTKGAIGNLLNRYRAVLKKCHLLNTFGSLAVAGMLIMGGAGMASATTVISEETSYSDQSFAEQNGTSGGAFYVNPNAELILDNVSFTDNTATTYGGAIFSGGTLTITNSTFTNNIAGSVGGALSNGTDSTGIVTISGSTFTNNHSVYDGGAIGNYSGLVITDSIFEGNTAQLAQDENGQWTVATDDSTPVGGGAISLGAVSDTTVASISNTIFKNNVSGKKGGAIGTRLGQNANNSAAKLDIAATFIGNRAQQGGAIYNTFYTNNGLDKGDGVTVTGLFSGNAASDKGGAIFNDGAVDLSGAQGGVMTITDASFDHNTATIAGGGIYNTGTLSVNAGSFTGNSAANGGAIYNDGGTVEVNNGTVFDKNTATAQNYGGGAIYSAGGEVNIGDNVTFSNNYLNQTVSVSDDKEMRSVGGAIAAWDSTKLTIGNNATFTNNGYNSQTGEIAWSAGGAIYLDTDQNKLAEMTIGEDANFSGNVAGALGGAIYAADSKTSITSAQFDSNKAGMWGGAIFVGKYFNIDGDMVSLSDSTFTNNQAGSYGGAIAIDHGNVTISGSTFTGNTVTKENGLGGAIYNNGTLAFEGTNSFSNNTADGQANDIYNQGKVSIAGGSTTLGSGYVQTAADSSPVDGPSLTVDDGATLELQGGANLDIQAGNVTFADNSTFMAEASRMTGDSSAITLGNGTAMTVGEKAKLVISNAVSGDTYTVVTDNSDKENGEWKYASSSTDLIRLDKITEGTDKVAYKATAVDATQAFAGLSSDIASQVNAITKVDGDRVNSPYAGVRFLARATENNTSRFLGNDKAAAVSTIESAARIAFAGAVPQMTKMASDSATNAVVDRMGFANPENGAKAVNVDGKLVDDKALGLALWIAPLWSNQTGFGMEAGNLDYGYNANIGGVSLGADYTWANNFRAGLMFNIGGGYAESSGDLSETTNSMTFWGVGAYGGWKYENFAIMGDVSYTSTWNSVDQDLDHRMQMGDLEADIQASAISAGLRFEYKLETQYLDFIPHVGARYMSINTWGYDVDSADGTILEGDGFQQNIWTFPVGITFSKELEMNNDWYFKPSVDFTVIPAAGDIKAKEDVRFTGPWAYSSELETQMMDYFTWQGGVGLEFGNDNMSVGVNYTLQAGQNSTGHGVFGMFRYEF